MPRVFAPQAPRALQSIGALPGVHAGREPDRPALTCGDESLTRRELADRVERRARALQAAGVGDGDFVAIALPNGTPFIEIAFACWRLGATPAPVSHRLPPAELRALLEVLNPRLVVGGEAARLAGAVVVEEQDLYDASPAITPLPSRVSRHVKAIASGGSTGRPKVIVDHAPALLDPDVPSLGMQCGDTVVVPGPMYHSAPFGLVYQALGWGCHVVIMPRFDAAETLRLVERHRGNWLYQVPTMMHRIWRLGDEERARYDVSSIEIVCHIAAPCPAWLKERWIDWLGAERIWEVYSGTEAIAATMIGGRDWLEHKGSVGRLMTGARIRILDDQGNDVVPGEVGEIYFLATQGQGSTYHYLGAEPRLRGDWETFGDLGRIDAEGYLYLADRRTDLVISGGANVYPAEVEAAIDAHPAVLASVVIGLPDADLGQRIHAIVEVRDGSAPLVLDDLIDFLATRLAAYKLPRSLETTRERVRDDSGKVRRAAWRDARIQSMP
ncbi:MAG TPA: AMP-binding protein [Steroidobacteraceae bacterium]